MFKNLVIGALAILAVVLGAAVARLENYHYASHLGMCSEFKADDALHLVERSDCLHKAKTRTSSLWNLFYGLSNY
jgi:hypothetical protein